MSRKVSTIKLTFFKRIPNIERDGRNCYEANMLIDAWRVITVTDSLEHTPGDVLDRRQVSDLCGSKDWKVTIGQEAK